MVDQRLEAAFAFAIVVATVLLAAGQLAAAPRKPVIVVVIASDDPAFRAREMNLATQLALALDGFTIDRFEPDRAQLETAAPPGVTSFSSMSLPQKLMFVGPFAGRAGAVAVIWMEDGGGGAAFLHVASQSTDRAFVRIVRAGGGPNTEEELAFAAQELLGQVYMLSTSPRHEAIDEVVEQVVDEARSLRLPSVGWGVLPFLTTGGGIYGHEGSSFEFGGGLALESIIGELFFARLSVAALAGPFMEPPDGVVSGWSIEPELRLGFVWQIADRFVFGFSVGAAPVYTTVQMSLGEGDHQASNWWNFHGSVGVEARVPLNDRVALVVTPSLAIFAVRKSFYRISDDSVVLRTPIIGWVVTAGVLIDLW